MKEPTAEGACASNGTELPEDACCEIFVIRHGQTAYNKIHRLQGQLDIPLNDEGRAQCRNCGQNIKKMLSSSSSSCYGDGFAAVYTSPLSRTRESAEIICKEAGIPLSLIKEDADIMEWNAGIIQGHLLDEIRTNFPREWTKWRVARDVDFVVEGGESLRMRYTRVRKFFSEKAALHMGQRILVLTHGGVMDDLLRYARDLPMDANTRASKPNAVINILHAFSNENSDPQSSTSGKTSAGSRPLRWEIIRWGYPDVNSEAPKDWSSTFTEYV